MHSFKTILNRLDRVGFVAAIFACVAQVGAAEIDFEIGHDGAEEASLVLRRPTEVFEPYELPFIPAGSLAGFYGSIEPGWDGLGVDRTDINLSALTEADAIVLERVRFDGPVRMFSLDGAELFTSNGAQHTFAGEPESDEMIWHEHLLFALEPGVDTEQTYSATFKLKEANETYGDSEEFTLVFQPVGSSCGSGGCGAMGMTGLVMSFLGLARMKNRR